jgi:adenylate cyclase
LNKFVKKNLSNLLMISKRIGETQRGRPIAFLWLLIFALVITFSDYTPFRMARSLLFDEYQSIFPRESVTRPLVIVEIDEATLGALGQWPWPRNYLAALIDTVNLLKPSAIGLDIIMPEADRASPQAIVESRPDLPEQVRNALINAQSNDKFLADSIAHAPIVLGAAGFSYNTSTTLDGLLTREVKIDGGNPIPWVEKYPYVLASLPEFQTMAKGQGLVSNNPEKGVLRRATLLSSINNTITPGLSLEVMRVALDAKHIVVSSNQHGVSGVKIAGRHFQLQSNGESWVYFDSPSRERYISAMSILKNEVPIKAIEGKMVLIGLTGLGLQDMISTPTGERRSGVEIHAQVIESLMDGKMLLRPWWIKWLEMTMLLVVGVLLIWLLPNSNIYKIKQRKFENVTSVHKSMSKSGINQLDIHKIYESNEDRRKHTRVSRIKVEVISSIIIFLFILFLTIGFGLFKYAGLLFDSLTPFIGLTVILVSLFFSAAIEFEKQRKETNNAFQSQRLRAAQIAGELNAARRIQLATLPDASKFYDGDRRFNIEATLEPAREVGGDLYDFFMIDQSRLFFIIGDVAGKGLPACLYMVVSKALAKSAAMGGGNNIGEIITRANAEMSRENPEMLFVTVLAGILNLDTGTLEIVNAGHDAPWLIDKMGKVDRLEGKGGPPLGIMEDMEYTYETIQLSAGDTLLLVTDGVHEAMNRIKDLYGVERIAALLENQPKDNDIKHLAYNLREDVRSFVGDTEASDDLTMLLIKWNG